MHSKTIGVTFHLYGMAPGICSLKITIHRTHFPFICLQEYAPSNPIQINPPIFSFHKVIFRYFPVRHKGKAESIHDSRSPWLHEIRRQRRMSISQCMKKSSDFPVWRTRTARLKASLALNAAMWLTLMTFASFLFVSKRMEKYLA